MATLEKIVDQTPIDQSPIDPNVIVPRHVREAAERAEAFYQPQSQPEPQPQPEPQAQHQPELQPQPQPEPQPQHQAPPQDNSLPVPTREQLQGDDWAGRYNSMRGRFERSNQMVGSLQEQLVQAGDEIGRLTTLLERAGVDRAPQPQNNLSHHNNVITEQDIDTYGNELLDTVARVARGAVQPEIDTLKNENAELKKRAITDGQRDLRSTLARAVPSWAAIQASQDWKRWLSLPNVYTGVVRGRMLKAAYDAADAPTVVALFQDFVKEVQATGGVVPTNQRQEQQAQPAPRQAAMSLEDLAAPGRAKPAGGDNPQGPADKPNYTRQQIAANYADRRKGIYSGRETEWARLDADMIAAGREGRIR